MNTKIKAKLDEMISEWQWERLHSTYSGTLENGKFHCHLSWYSGLDGHVTYRGHVIKLMPSEIIYLFSKLYTRETDDTRKEFFGV